MLSDNESSQLSLPQISVSQDTSPELTKFLMFKLVKNEGPIALSDDSSEIVDLIARIKCVEKVLNHLTHIQERVTALELELGNVPFDRADGLNSYNNNAYC